MNGGNPFGPDAMGSPEAFMRAAERINLPTDLTRIPQMMAAFQASMEASAREFAELTFDGCADLGDVTATVTAYGAVTNIRIGILAKRQLDNYTLGDAVVEAVRAARASAQNAWAERLASITLFGMPANAFMPKVD